MRFATLFIVNLIMGEITLDLIWKNSKTIVNIIEMAAQFILQIYHSDDFMVETKSDNSPLTKADKIANNYICEELKKLFPDIPIISEENKNDDYEQRKKYTWAWLIDPLDGTKEFIKKNGEFTVNIGLIYEGCVKGGFVNIPVEGKTYFAVEGRGSWLKEDGVVMELIGNRENYMNMDRELRVISSRSHMNEETKKFIAGLGNVEIVNVGSSIKIVWIAENRADIYPRIAPTMEWDTCAAHAILKEIGGNLKIYPGLEEEVRYNKENLLNPYFVAQMN